MTFINHLTLNTGHLARTHQGDVAPGVIALLSPWLESLIKEPGHPGALPVPELNQYTMQAVVEEGSFIATVFGPPLRPSSPPPVSDKAPPLVTFGVARRSRHAKRLWEALTMAYPAAGDLTMPEAPWIGVITYPALAAYPSAIDWMGDFERSVAWTWISRPPAQDATS